MGLTGFVNIIKPTCEGSSNIVCKVKKILGTKKVGHLGTLDPAATGVLPIAIGKATKFFDYFLSKEKEYVARVQFGKATDTLDSYGNLVETNDTVLSEDMINDILLNFIGEIYQTPPKYSAIKINGKRASDLARENADFEIKPRKITIFSIKLIRDCGKNQFLFRVHCSAGTYIRTLFSDIAEKLNTVSNTPVIIRIRSGFFTSKDAITIEELEKTKLIQSIENVFANYQKINVDEFTAKKLINGVKINTNSLKNLGILENEFFIAYNNELIGLYEVINDTITPKIYLYEGER